MGLLGIDIMRRLLRWLAPLFGVFLFALPARAQGGDANQSFAFTYFVGILMMIIVMVIVCMPSRKRPRVNKGDQ